MSDLNHPGEPVYYNTDNSPSAEAWRRAQNEHTDTIAYELAGLQRERNGMRALLDEAITIISDEGLRVPAERLRKELAALLAPMT